MDDLDALDRACALAQGWTELEKDMMDFFFEGTMLSPAGIADKPPSPTRDPPAFVALLLWHAREGRCALVSGREPPPPGGPPDAWMALVTDAVPFAAYAPCPMVALAKATAEWSARK